MKNFTLTICFFIWIAIPAINAQKSIGIMKPATIPHAGIQQKTLDTLLRSAEKAFFNYQAACSLTDPKTGKVTAGSIDKYLSLFEFNANVVLDFMDEDPLPDVKSPDYATFVYKYIPQGLNVRFVSAAFTNVNYDSLGFYRVYARMEKVVKTNLTKDLKPVDLKDSCVHTQYFTFYVEKNEMDKAKIFRIQNGGEVRCPHPPGSKSLSIFGAANLGLGLGKTEANGFWPSGKAGTMNFSASRVNVKGLSGGVKYQFHDKVSLVVGLNYNWYNTSVSLDTIHYKVAYDQVDTLDPTPKEYLRNISLFQLNESGRVSIAQASIGINYQMFASEKSAFGIDFLLMPGRVTRYKNRLHTEVKYSSLYTYTGSSTVFEVVIDQKLPNPKYLTGLRKHEGNSSLPYEKGVFMGIQIAPVYEYYFSPHIGLRLSGYCNVSLTSWFKTSSDPNTAPFLNGEDDIQYSILSEYVKSYKVSNFGLQAGLNYKIGFSTKTH